MFLLILPFFFFLAVVVLLFDIITNIIHNRAYMYRQCSNDRETEHKCSNYKAMDHDTINNNNTLTTL